MNFSITIEDQIQNPERAPYARGRVVLGDFEESFESPTHYWRPNDYRRQWREALERTAKGLDSGLITAAYQQRDWPAAWWILYRRNDHVLVQQVLVLHDLFPNFSPDNPYDSIPTYERESEDGELVSEWVIATADIKNFLETA